MPDELDKAVDQMVNGTPLVVVPIGQIVRCTECRGDMVIAPWYTTWPGHPGFRHAVCP